MPHTRFHPILALVLFTLAACAPSGDEAADDGPWDVLVTGGTVVDGTGEPGVVADVAVRGDRIVRVSVSPLPHEPAARVIDASGLVVAPGFIDVHAHLDPLLDLPEAESHVRQGVTTALGGPDGGGPWPLGEHLDSAAALGVGMNVALLTGHNTIRRRVMGSDARAPTDQELEEMRQMVARAMGEGAFGLSTGLRYVPGTYSEVDEVVALARVAADSGGIYTSHLREEGLELIEGVAELIEIGRRASITAVLTHHKVVGYPMWGSSERTLAMVDSAREAGIDVRIDQYPYTATYTGISILLPPWSLAGGDSAFARRIEDPVLRDSIKAGTVFNIVNDRGGNDLSRVQLARVEWMPELEGRTLEDWAEMRGMAPTPENGAELVIEAMERGGASAIYHALDEGDVERIMRHPQTMIASDGRLTEPGTGHPHPRWYGTFPRVLGRYVREEGVLTLEEAVRKMTSMPADVMGLPDRGRVAESMRADLVVFDPEAVIDRATFQDPHQYPDGIDFVMVNGVVTVDDGVYRDVRPGRVLRRGGG
ncbi:MAG: D-aminoacylase [Gemmatimonadota bacterium]|nr:D-aminoacylase [Gemmatimonadota bacterium]